MPSKFLSDPSMLGGNAVGLRFLCGLQELRVSFDGPITVVSWEPDPEASLDCAQESLMVLGDLAGAEQWLRTAAEQACQTGEVQDEINGPYLLLRVARLLSLVWVARGRADHSLRVLVAARRAGFGSEVMLQAAAETARWRLRASHNKGLLEAAILLMAASDGGLATWLLPDLEPARLLEFVAHHLPGPGMAMGNNPLQDGLEEAQEELYDGTGRTTMPPVRTFESVMPCRLLLDEFLAMQQFSSLPAALQQSAELELLPGCCSQQGNSL